MLATPNDQSAEGTECKKALFVWVLQGNAYNINYVILNEGQSSRLEALYDWKYASSHGS